jgi:predicted Fe-Mo cluster-binding NifX family protein
MKYEIAVTTSAGETVDLHFGQADSFSIYTVDSESGEYCLLEKRIIEEAGLPGDNQPESNSGCSGCNGARWEYIAKLLSGCIYLLTVKIGNRPHGILLSHGISALETPYPLEYAVKKLNDYKKQQQQKAV